MKKPQKKAHYKLMSVFPVLIAILSSLALEHTSRKIILTITHHLQKKKHFAPIDPAFQYPLSTAYRVLFFEDMKDTATSAKIKTTDAFGIDWKLKWGAEAQTEAMVELKPKAIATRGGPTAFSDTGATEDRVGRGSFLFNMWVWNMDAKDDNNRSVLVEDISGSGETSYLEFQHDLGVTFGGLFATGQINSFTTGNQFMYLNIFSGYMHFNQTLLYYPRLAQNYLRGCFVDGQENRFPNPATD